MGKLIQKIYDDKNSCAVLLRPDTVLQKISGRIKLYRLLHKTDKSVLIISMGKYSVGLSAQILQKIYNGIKKSQTKYVHILSYTTDSSNDIQNDVRKFVNLINMKK